MSKKCGWCDRQVSELRSFCCGDCKTKKKISDLENLNEEAMKLSFLYGLSLKDSEVRNAGSTTKETLDTLWEKYKNEIIGELK